jgi:hypothetical protein
MMQEQRLPEYDDCWECFQPKLFYYMVEIIVEATETRPAYITTHAIVLAQILNAFMGIVIILIVWAFLKSMPADNEQLKIVAFALTAFNPKLIGINAQATNDTLAILLSTLSLYFAMLFLRKEKIVDLLVCIIFLSLGLAAKTNIVITAVAILTALLVKAYISKRGFVLFSMTLFLSGIAFLSFLNPLTQYWTNHQKYGFFATTNKGIYPFPFPDFSEKSYFARPGITSIKDGILNFKYLNLLKYPRLTNDKINYPDHRTSLWTQVYARAYSVHFDNWPQSWSTEGNEYFPLTRAIYVLALVPTAMLIIGAGIGLSQFLVTLFANLPSTLRTMDYGLFVIVFWFYIAFLILYSLLYRDFSFMKAIFIYPALLSFIVFFIQSGNALQRILKNHKWFTASLSLLSTCLVILYILDIYTLTVHLHSLLN